MPSDDERRADHGRVEAGGAGRRPSARDCRLLDPDGSDLLPPPQPRDRRLLLLLRAADLPRLHDPDPGRDALPGVRQPADQGGAGRRRRRGRLRQRARRPRPDRAQRRRLPGRDRERQRRLQRRQRQLGRRRLRPLRRRRSPKASGTGSSPAASSTPASSTSPSTCSPLFFLGRHARAGDRHAALRRPLLRLAARPGPSGRCCSTPDALTVGASGRGLRHLRRRPS